jgi:hypothetical protein
LKSLDKQTVEDEMKELTSSYQNKFMFSLKWHKVFCIYLDCHIEREHWVENS